MEKYEDIINLVHHVSATHPPMAPINRAAQFSPFAALTGHDAAIRETARQTDERIELDEYVKDSLKNKLQYIIDHIKKCPKTTITYFQQDEKKKGGAYITVTGNVKKIDEYERNIVMIDGTALPIDDIISIENTSEASDIYIDFIYQIMYDVNI